MEKTFDMQGTTSDRTPAHLPVSYLNCTENAGQDREAENLLQQVGGDLPEQDVSEHVPHVAQLLRLPYDGRSLTHLFNMSAPRVSVI